MSSGQREGPPTVRSPRVPWEATTHPEGRALEQRSLLDQLEDDDENPGTIAERFATFHALHPWVYDALVRLARDLRARGRDRVGVGMLWEVLRWSYWMETDDPTSDFKLNDHYRSRYARLIMEREADLAGIFETRNLRAA